MDQELKVFLEAMENRLQAGIVGAVESRMDGMEVRIDGKLDAMEHRLRAHTETVETRLLSEFWKWARSSDIKTRQH